MPQFLSTILSTEGPYKIHSVGDEDKFYLRVDLEKYMGDNHMLEVTKDKKKASSFCIVPRATDNSPHGFILLSHCIGNKSHIRRHLNVHINLAGHNSSPLHFKLNAIEADTDYTLTVHSCHETKYRPQDISDWLHGKDAMYINVAHRRGRGDAYLCIKRFRTRIRVPEGAEGEQQSTPRGSGEPPQAAPRGSGESSQQAAPRVSGESPKAAKAVKTELKDVYVYTAACMPERQDHDGSDTLMLFCLSDPDED